MTLRTADLEGIKIGLCQQPCLPAQPEYNGAYFRRCIEDAESDGVDLLVGVEGIQGYLVGDQVEYHQFLRDIDEMNRNIQTATANKQVVVAYGSLVTDWHTTGEDGRVTRHNGGFVLQNGRILRQSNKTLSPNYRMFPEARYFTDNRKLAERLAWQRPVDASAALVLRQFLTPVDVKLRDGRTLKLGQEFCEDMWDGDYAIKPTRILAENGADIIINHSASPWTWRKNNKRHRVVKDLMATIPREVRPQLFVYVNRTGMEQSNKNFYIYDGSSAVYDSDGDLIFEVEPYYQGTKTFVLSSTSQPIEGRTPDDTEALHDAAACFVDCFFMNIPEQRRFVYVGISGGVDSSVVAAMLVSRPCLGPARVIGVNMPYGDFNAPEGKDDARALAGNLGITYLTVDITRIVDAIVSATNVEVDTLAHQNIQARCRMEILAALAQRPGLVNGLEKTGGLFTANGNKDEMTFGYGTMYGDVAGAVMLLVDLVKREVYQLGDYLNREIYQKEVIPAGIFTRKPSAELDARHSADPFDYGNLTRRGYHDEWVRAVTEFRWDPARFLTEYHNATLETSMLLPPGHLATLFPTAQSFVERLAQDWSSFTGSYWKRMQCPPGPVFTRRAYGGDLAESMYGFPSTDAYKKLTDQILGKNAG